MDTSFKHTAATEIYTLSLHDALPISGARRRGARSPAPRPRRRPHQHRIPAAALPAHQRGTRAHAEPDPRPRVALRLDRKSTRLNSSHMSISYAVFCLKKKKTDTPTRR